MDDQTRELALEAYSNALAELEGKEKVKAKEGQQLQLFGVEDLEFAGENACTVAQEGIDTIQSIISQFSWFIPDKYENPAVAALTMFETVILPSFCGKTVDQEAVKNPGKKSKVLKNFNTNTAPAA